MKTQYDIRSCELFFLLFIICVCFGVCVCVDVSSEVGPPQCLIHSVLRHIINVNPCMNMAGSSSLHILYLKHIFEENS